MPHTEIAPLHIVVEAGVGLVALSLPPVNALGSAMRRALIDAIDALNVDPEVKVIAIYGEGRALSAGADIAEFGKPPLSPSLPEVMDRVERSGRPVVVVLHGTTLGGGLELALSCQVRVGLPGAEVGLPEVTLGLLPGAGGTQRLPRLVPLDEAIDIIATGRRVPVEEALALGIVDRLASGEPVEAALTAAASVLDGTLVPRRTGEIAVEPDPVVIAAAIERLSRKRPALVAPIQAVEAIAHAGKPLAEGLVSERAMFLELMAGPDRQGLIHAFNAERAVRRIPEAGATPRTVETVGVIGGGTMGVGIATALLQAALPVTLVETTTEQAETAKAAVAANLAGAVKRGKLRAEERDRLLSRFTASAALEDLAEVDLVVEAVFEDIAVKIDLFRRLDAICRPGAVLGTNTSYLDVDAIAAATSRPQDVVGLHFFSPAHLMRLLEVVVGDRTSPEVVATAFALATQMKKVAVRAGVCDGFIGNRILAHFRQAADHMLLDGASFDEIDRALEAFGFAMGPFAVADLAGLDIGWANRKRRAPTHPPQERYVTIADRLCERGWFGRKTARGYYLYEGTGPRRVNADAVAIVAAEREIAEIEPRAFAEEEIVARYMTALICEASRVIEDGIALRPIDIDAVFLFGYGFPRHLGGPLNYADRIGAAALVERARRYAIDDPHYWRMPPLLLELAETGRAFSDLNEGMDA